MKEMIVTGEYNTAKIFAVDNDEVAVDYHTLAQVKMICDNKLFEGARIRLMPDLHAGKIGPIGLTIMFNKPAIIPGLIGPDIGCGVSTYKVFPKRKLTVSDFEKLDRVIRENIPAGFRSKPNTSFPVDQVQNNTTADINIDRVIASFATLGGGNHFIELGEYDGEYYLTIHSGSRSLGSMIDTYYRKEGQKILKARNEEVPYEMTYIEDDLFYQYLKDVRIADEFAMRNRTSIAYTICREMKWALAYHAGGSHNKVEPLYPVGEYKYILRKGAISTIDETMSIPVNMKDGIIITKGKWLEDWNYSCPHGSGRLVKRSDVKNITTVSEFKKDMIGIFSTSINASTLDESAIAYRRMNDILTGIEDFVDIIKIIKPVYSFKAGGRE